MILHQIVPMLEPGAVGSHTLVARAQLRAAGHTSDVFTDLVHPASTGDGARPLREYRGGADVLVYQMAIGSVAADFVLGRHEPIVVNHHNFTPLRYLAGWEPVAAHAVVWGRAQLRELATRAQLGIAVSHYNEADLIEASFKRSMVIPILLDVDALGATPPEPQVTRADAATWLFVGRLAPNKAQHDLVKALAAYRRFHDPDARLVLVGSGVEGPYGQTLARFVHALELDDAVTMTGAATPAQLSAYFRNADVFVVTSEHEGFCVPLLEAMHHKIPIVAYAAAAVPETLGDAGLLLSVKDPCTIAAAAHRVITDRDLGRRLTAAGTRRLQDFALTRTGPQFVEAITSAA